VTQYVDYVLGLDLGPPAEYSALAVVEEPVWSAPAWAEPLNLPATGWLSPADLTPHQVGQARSCAYHYGRPAKPPLFLRHLERWAPGTTYPRIAEQVGAHLHTGPLGRHASILVLDGTAVGPAIVDLFRGVGIAPAVVTITGGDIVQVDGALHRVPRRDLVSAVQAVLQTERLKIAAALPEARTLTEELLTFQMRQTPATAAEVPWREGPRDDLVLATALAVWWREWWSEHLDRAQAEHDRDPMHV
jgi:hypothetical protein